MRDRINRKYADAYLPGTWARPYELQSGDIVTITGVFKRRTLWQWLTAKPRELVRFIVR